MSLISKIFTPSRSKPGAVMDRQLKVDIHSHLIPGIDDGCKTMEQVGAILWELHDQGIQKVITTPHVIYDLYPNTFEKIAAGEEAVLSYIKEREIPVEFKATAEYYIDETFAERHLKGSDPLRALEGRYILVETNYVDKPGILEEVIFELKLKGYEVVLAHPERYHYLLPDVKLFHKLKETGVLFQVNMMSFTGHYSNVIKKAAEYLLKENMIDLIGSDIHKIEHSRVIRNLKHLPVYNKLMRAGLLNNQL